MKYYYFVSFAHVTQKSVKYNGYGNSEIKITERIKSIDQLNRIKEFLEQKIMSGDGYINNIDKTEIVILNYIFLRKEED